MSIFLCHSSNDKAVVRQLYQKLSRDGFDVWLDEEKLLPGQDWDREITRAVRHADTIIICLSQGSITKSGYYQKEIKLALDVADEKPDGVIFPIPARLEECNVPERLSRYQWTDLYKPEGYEKLIKALRFAASKKEEANNIATDTNTKVEMGIKNPLVASDQKSKYSSRPIQHMTIALRSPGGRKRFKKIYYTLINFMGKDRFSFQISENNQSYLVDFPKDTTRICPELLEHLRRLMGDENWRVEEIQVMGNSI